MDSKEIGVIIANNTIINVVSGTALGAEFDFFKVWEYWKENRFHLLIMIHSHPKGYYDMSSIDKNMLAGWAKAFPIPILFIVISRNENFDYARVYAVVDKKIIDLDRVVIPINDKNILYNISEASYNDESGKHFKKLLDIEGLIMDILWEV